MIRTCVPSWARTPLWLSKGDRGEYLLALDDGLTEENVNQDYCFDYISDDKVEDFVQEFPLDDVNLYLYMTGRRSPDYLKEQANFEADGLVGGADWDHLSGLHGTSATGYLAQVEETRIPDKLRKTLYHGIRAAHNDLDQAIEVAFRSVDRAPQFWEIYSGNGGLAAAMRELGFETREFTLPEWDFEKAKDRAKFLELLEAERPEICWFAPPCTKWSPLQGLNARTPERSQLLEAERDYHHATHLRFTSRGPNHVHHYGGISVVEHPKESRAWRTSAFHKLKGTAVDVDQCAMGATLPDDNGYEVAVRKRTRLLATKESLTDYFKDYQCTQDHDHLAIMGTSPYLGSRAAAMATYQPTMCSILAKLLLEQYLLDHQNIAEAVFPAADGDPHALPSMQELFGENDEEDTSPKNATLAPSPATAAESFTEPSSSSTTNEPQPATGILKKLETVRPGDATRLVARLHRNMGHPTKKDLHAILSSKGASQTVLDMVMAYSCPTCHKLAPPAQSARSALRTSYKFNERLLSDTIWLQVTGRPTPVVTMLDAASKFLAARVVKKETSGDFLQALQRGWIRTFGPPQAIHVDSHRAWGSEEVRDFATEHDIQLVISPGEAHNRLASLERRHHVLRKSVEAYMTDKADDSMDCLQEALCFVVPQINASLSVGGFSPTQWVLGYQPHLEDRPSYNYLSRLHLLLSKYNYSYN